MKKLLAFAALLLALGAAPAQADNWGYGSDYYRPNEWHRDYRDYRVEPRYEYPPGCYYIKKDWKSHHTWALRKSCYKDPRFLVYPRHGRRW